MKKIFTFIVGLGMVAGANAQNPFAYGLSTDGNVVSPSAGVLTVNVNYSLNADAESVNALIKNAEGEVVKTLPLSGITKGTYENVELDLAGIGYGDFTWAIEVKGGATEGSLSEFKNWSFYHPSGLDVDNSPESPSFGTIFVAEGYTTGKTSGYVSAQADGTDGGGLYMFTPALESISHNNNKTKVRFYSDKLTHSRAFGTTTSGADFSCVAVAEDGRIFVTRHNGSGDYILSAESVESLVKGGEFTSLVAGRTMNSDNAYTDDEGNFLVGPIQYLDVKGAGENTKIIAINCTNLKTNYALSNNKVVEYEIGEESSLPTPSTFDALQNFTISYDRAANVVYDSRGGVWYCQSQSAPTSAKPALVYVDANGEQKFFEGDGGKYRRKGAIAVNPEATRLVVSTSAGGDVSVYDIAYGTDGTVTLNEVYSVDTNTGKTASRNLLSATWDVAGNFYVCDSATEFVKGYAVPRANNVFATPAASKYALNIDKNTAVGEINTDANAPVEYYNLQGVKVENPANGIFIRKQGSKTTKVVL